MDSPLAEGFAHTEVGGDLCRSFSRRSEFHQSVARDQKSSAKPVVLFLFVGVVAEKKQPGLRYFDASGSVAQLNVCEFMHQIRSLALNSNC